MDPFRLLVRMAYWLRRPPSRRHVIAAAIVIAAAAVILAAESAGYWPEAFRLEPQRRHLVAPG